MSNRERHFVECMAGLCGKAATWAVKCSAEDCQFLRYCCKDHRDREPDSCVRCDCIHLLKQDIVSYLENFNKVMDKVQGAMEEPPTKNSTSEELPEMSEWIS